MQDLYCAATLSSLFAMNKHTLSLRKNRIQSIAHSSILNVLHAAHLSRQWLRMGPLTSTYRIIIVLPCKDIISPDYSPGLEGFTPLAVARYFRALPLIVGVGGNCSAAYHSTIRGNLHSGCPTVLTPYSTE